jgi:preprotein translocase subunit SecA
LERFALLTTIDQEWKDHLYEMDQLRSGIGLRAYGQRNPLIEYKKEAYGMFTELQSNINHKALEKVYRLQPVDPSQEQRRPDKGLRTVHESITGTKSLTPERPEETKPTKRKPVRREGKKVGRNDPCPCGSGKKYKKCCGAA